MKDHHPHVQSAQHLTVLLVALCLFFLLVPILPYLGGWTIFFRVGLTVVFIANLLAHRHRFYFFYTALSLVVLAVLLTWVTLAVSIPALVFAYHVETSLLLALTAVSILITVVSKHAATATSIVGAVLVYLLFGLSWALMYSGIHAIDVDAFDVPMIGSVVNGPETDEVDDTEFSLWVYFSFVTMSTLGYGDITPLSPFAQTFAWMQSVAGQFYLAILVARLISILPERQRES